MREQEVNMSVGIVREDIYLEHITDDYHPENTQRLVYIYAMLQELDPTSLTRVPARMATQDEIALIHDPSYIAMVAETSGKPMRRLDPDTVTSPKSYEAACMAVGGVLELVEAVQAGRVENGFALVRPPGHHAERARAMGFCIFNNIAVAARYLEKHHGMSRILIIDWDLHHGNGTQHSFYEDPTVLYMSTHQYPYYPGTGWFDETGEGKGKGYTVNVPTSHGFGDDDYLHIFETVVVPVATRFNPEIVLVSAGFDIHQGDPLGGMSVTEAGFARMARLLMDLAAAQCGGKIVFVLEGGYYLEGLTNSVKAVLMELAGTPMYPAGERKKPSAAAVQAVAQAKQALKPYWGDF